MVLRGLKNRGDLMNKNQEKTNRAALHRLLDVVLDVNGFEKRQREKTGDKPTVFFELFGHTAECEVRVHKTGWAEDERSDMGSCFYFDRPLEIDELINLLEKLKR